MDIEKGGWRWNYVDIILKFYVLVLVKYCLWECVMNLIWGYLKVKVIMDMILLMSVYIIWVKNFRLIIL